MSTPSKKGGKKGAPAAAEKPTASAPSTVKSKDAPDDDKDEGVTAPNEVAEEKANDQATGLAPAEENAAPLERYSFDLLANIKAAQLQNGLRHGDFARYKKYNARRLRRLRVGLKCTGNKREYKSKAIEASEIDDVRYLAIPLVCAERCWSYAMELKNDMTQETQRKRFHLLKRLTKAVQWASTLETLCETRADTRTQLQAQAYASWMAGLILFERSAHEKALAKFLQAKTVYEKLGSIGGSAMQILCEERVANLADSIRFCKYMLRAKSGGASGGEDDELLLEDTAAGGHDDLLTAKLEELRRERMVEQAKTLDTIEWQVKIVPVSNEKLRLCFVEAKTLREQLDKALAAANAAESQSGDSSAAPAGKNESKESKEDTSAATDGSPESQNLSLLYQKLFASYDESLKVLRDALLEPKMLEAHKAHLLSLKDFSTFQRLEVQVIRNEQFIHSLCKELKQQERSPHLYRTKRKNKPDEVVLLYEKIQAALQEMQEIQTASKNQAQVKLLQTKLLGVQAARVFYLAESYRRLKKHLEAWMLYSRSLELGEEYQKAVSKLGSGSASSLVQGMDQLRRDALFARGTTHAHALLEHAEQVAKVTKGVQAVKVEEGDKTEKAASASTLSLTSRLDSYEAGDPTQQHQLLEFPPSFAAAPTKPILFDLAFNTFEYPDVSKKVKELEKKGVPTPAPAKAEAKKPAAASPTPAKAQAKETPAPAPTKQTTPSKQPAAAPQQQKQQKKVPEPEPEGEGEEEESEEEEEEEESPAPAPVSKKPAAAAKPTKVPEPEPQEEEEYPSLAASAPAPKKQQQPQQKKTIAPPGEKESVKRERERREKEEEEKRKKAEEDAKKAKGWGLGGLVGKIWGR